MCNKEPLYTTKYGQYYIGKCETEIKKLNLKRKVQLIITSPPFPLNSKKKYGNLKGEAYLNWLKDFAPLFSEILIKNGSIVIELGNAWEENRPVQSLIHLKSLMSFVEHPKANLRLCQEFIYYNPARLPSPAQWVTIKRIRTIDSFTYIWWMSNSDYPKADNIKVLHPYSMFSISNTRSNDFFTRKCKERNVTPHPARMPLELVSFFIDFLTDEGDLVLDPFCGSNTTGFCAEKLKRNWIGIEINKEYGLQSMIRFEEYPLEFGLKKETV
jgi:site-specific DNA-methyltransferase (cytosine-N4-specific)